MVGSLLFNSYAFIFLFLPAAIAGYYLLQKTGKPALPKLFLTAASLFWAGCFNLMYPLLLAACVCANYFAALGMRKAGAGPRKKLLFAASLVFNIGLLLFWRYAGLFSEGFDALFGAQLALPPLIAGLGIGVFTLQQLSFLIDSYKGEAASYRFIDFAAFASFFPVLAAGPAAAHSAVIPQFSDEGKRRFDSKNFAMGLTAFTLGLAKKVLLANTFAAAADIGFGDIAALDTTNAAVAVVSFALQIYFELSGYCDMAVGLGLFFNIDLPHNFNSPFRAAGIQDFLWRWNVSLGAFLRRHIYEPLGAETKGKARTVINIFAACLAGCLFYGAKPVLFVWGALLAAAASVAFLLRREGRPPAAKPVKLLLRVLTLVFVTLAWIYFRADTFAGANAMLLKLFAFDFGPVARAVSLAYQTPEFAFIGWLLTNVSNTLSELFLKSLLLAYTAFGIAACTVMKNTGERLKTFRPNIRTLLAVCLLFVWSAVSLSAENFVF